MSPECPAAKLGPGEVIEPVVDGLAYAGAVVVRPAPDFGVELVHQLPLRQGLPALNNPPKLRQMFLYVGFGRFDQGFVPQAPRAPGAFARLVFAHPILPDVKPQKLHPGLIAFQGVTDAAFGFIQMQAHLRQPRPEQLLTMLEHLAVFVEHHAIISLGDDTGLRVHPGDGLIHAMQGNQG